MAAKSFSLNTPSFTPSTGDNPFMKVSTSEFKPTTASAPAQPVQPKVEPKVEPPKPKEKGIIAIEKLVSDSATKEDDKTEEEKKETTDQGDLIKELSQTFDNIKKEKAESKQDKISIENLKAFISQVGKITQLPTETVKEYVTDRVVNRETGVSKPLPKPEMKRGNRQY